MKVIILGFSVGSPLTRVLVWVALVLLQARHWVSQLLHGTRVLRVAGCKPGRLDLSKILGKNLLANIDRLDGIID